MRYEGGCHCGTLRVLFETEQAPGRTAVRQCGCTFCRKHGATAVTDPSGSLEVRIRDAEYVSRYVFGLRTSEFLVCSRCGVYVAAICVVDGERYGSLNLNVLDDRAAFTQPPSPVDYDAEDIEHRLARRKRAWTPLVESRAASR
jgi:hypothetical protein